MPELNDSSSSLLESESNDNGIVIHEAESITESVGASGQESSSQFDSVHFPQNKSPDSIPDSILAKRDTKAAFHLRVLVVLLFLFMSIFVPIIIYTTARNNEQGGFESEFEALATKVIDSFEFNVARKLGAIDSLGISVTSHGTKNSVPPNVTIPDFDLRAANTLALADAFSVFLVPLVDRDGRLQWEQYAVENQGWVEVAMNRESTNDWRRRNLQTTGISETIYRSDANGDKISEDQGDLYCPVWQNAPVYEDIVNFNLLSVDTLKDGILAMKQTEEAVLGRVAEFSENEVVIQEYFETLLEAEISNGEPISSLFYPVLDSFEPDAGVVSLFSMAILWSSFFEGVSSFVFCPVLAWRIVLYRSKIHSSFLFQPICVRFYLPTRKELFVSLKMHAIKVLRTKSMVKRPSFWETRIFTKRSLTNTHAFMTSTRFSNQIVLPSVKLLFH